MAIVDKLRTSLEATKESYESLIALGACLAASAVCALIGIMIWVADFFGTVLTCFLFSGLFMLAAGIVKFVIDAKEKKATRKFKSAKHELKQDVAAITTPLKLASGSASDHPIPFVSLGMLAGLAVIAYYLKQAELPSN